MLGFLALIVGQVGGFCGEALAAGRRSPGAGACHLKGDDPQPNSRRTVHGDAGAVLGVQVTDRGSVAHRSGRRTPGLCAEAARLNAFRAGHRWRRPRLDPAIRRWQSLSSVVFSGRPSASDVRRAGIAQSGTYRARRSGGPTGEGLTVPAWPEACKRTGRASTEVCELLVDDRPERD